MKRKFVKVISIFVEVLMIGNLICLQVSADQESIKNQIEENNSKIEQIEAEKESIIASIEIETKDLNEINGLIAEKEQELNEIQGRINELQSSIDAINYEIALKEENIRCYEEDIEEKNKDIKYLEAKEKETKKMLDDRLISYYKSNMASTYLYVLLESSSISEFLNTLGSLYKIMLTDKNLIAQYNSAKEDLVDVKKELEDTIKILEEEKLAVEKEEEELILVQESIIAEKLVEQEEMNYLASLEEAKKEIIYSLESQNNVLSEQIESLISFNAELQAELDAIMNEANSNNGGSIGNEGEYFLRPTSGVITCHYGPRYDPISGVPGFHSGTDFGDWYGTPILASKSGQVYSAGWISGYGNTVIINHGDGVQTLYAHAESLNVSAGQYVNQGDVVAYVGSTGWSTGPHLHFEIRINGATVDPMSYLPY